MERPVEVMGFLESLRERGLSPHTINAYEHDITDFGAWYGRDILGAVPGDISDYLTRLRRRKKSAATRARSISAIKAYYRWAKRTGLITADPAAGLKSVKVMRGTMKTADEESLNAVMKLMDPASPRGRRDMAMMRLCLDTGLRVSELTGLRLGDIDIKKKRIMLKEAALSPSKETMRCVGNYLKKGRPYLFKDNISGEYVFLSLRGTPMTRQGFWKVLRSYSGAAGVNDVTPGTLRASYAARLVREGATPDMLCGRLRLKGRPGVSEYMGTAGIVR